MEGIGRIWPGVYKAHAIDNTCPAVPHSLIANYKSLSVPHVGMTPLTRYCNANATWKVTMDFLQLGSSGTEAISSEFIVALNYGEVNDLTFCTMSPAPRV